MKKKTEIEQKVKEIQGWFRQSVTYEGKPYTIDQEQALAVVDESDNAIVVARAGSGKTRTIVAKVIYLVAKCGLKPEEILIFVFNSNAAAEINARLEKMLVDGKQVIKEADLASTFHAFARKIVYDVCKKREECGEILVDERERLIRIIISRMLKKKEWDEEVCKLMQIEGGDIVKLRDEERDKLVRLMGLFVNRAQQRFLGSKDTIYNKASKYCAEKEIGEREEAFIKIGLEVFKKYHLFLLGKKKPLWAKGELSFLKEYGTDFNLIVSWASKMIESGGIGIDRLLGRRKYMLIDEYQDFSQLFLANVMAIRKTRPEIHLFVVGDDWQAINRFAGSDVRYFKEFEKYFPGRTRRLEISTNYRCDGEIVRLARKFMKKAMHEKGHFYAASKKNGKVVLVDPKKTETKYSVVSYDSRMSERDWVYIEVSRAILGKIGKESVVQYLKTIIQIIKQNEKAQEILILHRNNDMNLGGATLTQLADGLKYGLAQLKIMGEAEFTDKVSIMTMHKSKGLEAEVVIILEADEGVIPKSHPDTLLYGLFDEDEEMTLDDQKRLFYVAMTRAKRRLYILHTPLKNHDGFIKYLGKGVEVWEE